MHYTNTKAGKRGRRRVESKSKDNPVKKKSRKPEDAARSAMPFPIRAVFRRPRIIFRLSQFLLNRGDKYQLRFLLLYNSQQQESIK